MGIVLSEPLMVVTLVSGIAATAGMQPPLFVEDIPRKIHMLFFSLVCLDASVYFFR